MERGWPPQSFATSDSRVSSPRAAKTGARAARLAVMRLRPLRDIALNILHLLCPAPVIHAECFEAAAAGDFVETGFTEQKQCAARGLFQPEFDERRRLLRVICFGIY